MEIADSVRRFIKEELMFGDASTNLNDDTPLCEGIIDSIALMELVAFLEERFGVQIDDEDLTSDNFRTIGAIERMVARQTDST